MKITLKALTRAIEIFNKYSFNNVEVTFEEHSMIVPVTFAGADIEDLKYLYNTGWHYENNAWRR